MFEEFEVLLRSNAVVNHVTDACNCDEKWPL